MITGGAVMACAAWRIPFTPLGAAMTAGVIRYLDVLGIQAYRPQCNEWICVACCYMPTVSGERPCGRATFISRWENPVSLSKMVLVSKCRG